LESVLVVVGTCWIGEIVTDLKISIGEMFLYS